MICNLLFEVIPHIKWFQRGVWVRAWYDIVFCYVKVVRFWVLKVAGELFQVVDG